MLALKKAYSNFNFTGVVCFIKQFVYKEIILYTKTLYNIVHVNLPTKSS